MTYESEQELRDEIATLHDMIRELSGEPLTPIEHAVLKGALDGTKMQTIADQFEVQKPTISKIANKLRRRGLHLPNWPNTIEPKSKPPRFHASGVSPGGSWVSCAADTQAKADAMIAALVTP